MGKDVGPGRLSRNPQICCATGKMWWAGFGIVHGKEDVDSYRRDQNDGRQESGDCRGAFGASKVQRRECNELFTDSGTGVESRREEEDSRSKCRCVRQALRDRELGTRLRQG
jgi:hypothetical protein